MSKIKLEGNALGTGTLTIAAPNTNTDRTLTLPDEAGEVLTDASSLTQNSGPAFYATLGSGQSISAGTVTKLTFNTETFDTDSCFDTSNYRFTPTVEGYYLISCNQEYSPVNGPRSVQIQKNGARVASDGGMDDAASGTFMNSSSVVLYMNGTTDYVEVYGYTADAATAYSGTSSMFSGCLLRTV